MNMLKEIRPLYERGFSLIWLNEKSKAPLETGWTKRPDKKWTELEKAFRPGLNVGVRLGRPLDGKFLAVVDCDVKSTEFDHKLAMIKKLLALFPAVKWGPLVESGRGNGSCHYYVLTDKPAKATRLAQSSEKVKVHMPSALRVSQYEKEKLTADEIKKGMRLRAAWEISLMGEGQQVVLPPSVHPDSGKHYLWARRDEKIPVIAIPEDTRQKPSMEESGSSAFEPISVDLASRQLPVTIVSLIQDGEGCSGDRSASLFVAAMALVKAGFSDQEILSVLTDQATYLGATPYEHAKTRSRGKAAAWVRRFTLQKARREVDAREQFKAEVVVSELEPDDAASQALELVGDPDTKDWKEKLDRTEQGGIKQSLKNVILILEGTFGPGLFKRDLFADTELHGIKTPWGGVPEHEIKDKHITDMKVWFSHTYHFEPATDKLNEAISHIAGKYAFHPVRDYLSSLTWDGKPRLDTWIRDYLGGQAEEPYLSAISRKVLCAMVARIFEPGRKFDYVLILEGKQGLRKSTIVRALTSDKWFGEAPPNIADKDAILSMRSVWAMELGELSSFSKADVDQLKEFITRTVDRIRLPYGRRTESFPRQCIFIGTTNAKEYLKDDTGNRRFWPVAIANDIDVETLERDRDQLFAEARFAYELEEPLYLSKREESVAVEEQAQRTWQDSWVEEIAKFLTKPDPNFPVDEFTIGDLFSTFGPLPMGTRQATKAEQMRAASALRVLGYQKVYIFKNNVRTFFWKKQKSLKR